MTTKLLLLFIAAAVVIIAGIQYHRHVDPEIVAAGEAIHQAKSWQAKLELHPRNGAGLWSTITVVCPDRTELVLIGAYNSHTIQIGDKTWTQDIAPLKWTEVPNNDQTPDPCKVGIDQPVLFRSPVAKAMAIVAEFDRAVRHHLKFSRGEMSEADGEICRNWTVEGSYTVCLSEKDHLPLTFTSLDGTVKAAFTQWNEKISINEPQNQPYVMPRPEPLPEVEPYQPAKPSY